MNKKERKPKRNKLKIILEISLFLICCIVFIHIRNDTFFYPRNDISSYQQLKNLNNFEEINISDNDINLNWWMYHDNSDTYKKPVIIYFGGNAENSSNTMWDFLSQWIFESFEWYNFLMLDYPWYWYSEGKPTKKNILNTTNYIHEWINRQSNLDNKNIFIIWYSFWTKVAIHYASEHKIKGLILIAPDEVAPYNGTKNLYKNIINIFYSPMKWISKNKLKLLLKFNNINVETQIITSYKNQVIEYSLSNKPTESVKYRTILNKNIEHSEYFYQNEVINIIKNYLIKNFY